MRILAILCATGLLTACGSGEETMTYTSDDGEATVATGQSAASADLPQGFTMYPGATVISNTTVTTSDGEGAVVMFTSDASPEELVGHFRSQAEAAGVVIEAEINTNGTLIIGGESADGVHFSFTAIPGEDGNTTGNLSVGRTPGN